MQTYLSPALTGTDEWNIGLRELIHCLMGWWIQPNKVKRMSGSAHNAHFLICLNLLQIQGSVLR